ncbi:MAG: metalloregulator ArsR/SmtB family transcription factor [Syntrophales bacterium]|nr:metalloregulator ArsR/SmtB family transcription factor [Syntrophales bacterium]MDD5640604.1 metalloregulator ArsR/SmtB family transcription factor [Syntrophales bacterium]
MVRNIEKKVRNTPAPVSEEEARLWEMQADICQTLANPKRLQVLNLLKNGEMSVGAMVEALGVAKANLSQHLGVMRQKGILVTRREGTSIYYHLATPHIAEACKIMRLVLLEALTARGELSRSILQAENLAAEAEQETGRKE